MEPSKFAWGWEGCFILFSASQPTLFRIYRIPYYIICDVYFSIKCQYDAFVYIKKSTYWFFLLRLWPCTDYDQYFSFLKCQAVKDKTSIYLNMYWYVHICILRYRIYPFIWTVHESSFELTKGSWSHVYPGIKTVNSYTLYTWSF